MKAEKKIIDGVLKVSWFEVVDEEKILCSAIFDPKIMFHCYLADKLCEKINKR